ncbi:hypothetical protein Tco_0565955 [Tanacetum coccineum]
MQMQYCFVNNVHVDYADLLCEGFHYSLEHPSTLIPYPKFTKLIISHYMTAYPKISRRVRDKYHNLEHDEMVKSIFYSGKNKAGVGMKIPSWMITDEIKLTENYQMTTSARRTPSPDVDKGESSAQRKSTVIRLRIPPRRSTRLAPPTPIKSHDELEAKQNVEKVEERLIIEEIEKLVERTENVKNVVVDNSISHSQNDPGTRFKPMSYKESSEVEKIVVVSQHVNIIEEDNESAEDDYELRRREKGKEVEGMVMCFKSFKFIRLKIPDNYMEQQGKSINTYAV